MAGEILRSVVRSGVGRGRQVMSAPEVLMEGIVFGESPRWHDGQVWFSDWGANQVIALDTDGIHTVLATVPSFPMCIDFLPDGRLLVVDSAQRRLLRREPDGSLVQHAEPVRDLAEAVERHRGRRPGQRLRQHHRFRLSRR
jgi:sugar lactone lactonase YvrE